MHTITLYVFDDAWMARFSNPAIARIMGSPVVPTSFTAQAPAERVLARIRALNPECDVRLSTKEQP